MNPAQEHFQNNKYVYLNRVLDAETCKGLAAYLRDKTKDMKEGDVQCPLSPSIYGDKLMDTLLEDLRPVFEKATGLQLLPTYSYARVYRPGDELKPHVDREACEISVTLTLGHSGVVWPIWASASKDSTDRPTEYALDTGDALIYRGTEINHWREKYTQGEWQAQVFLHYVDANGPYKDHKFDKREKLSSVAAGQTTKNPQYDQDYWYLGTRQEQKHLYTFKENFLVDSLIDMIVEWGSKHVTPGEVGHGADNSIVDKKTRNAMATGLPFNEFGWLYRYMTREIALENQNNFKFILDRIEGLTYIEYHGLPNDGGKYVRHTDGMIHTTRKLSFAVQLSDPSEYEGGEFIFWQGERKFVLPKKKGLVTFFPSYVEHEVTPVTCGLRRSLVGWIHGPHFM